MDRIWSSTYMYPLSVYTSWYDMCSGGPEARGGNAQVLGWVQQRWSLLPASPTTKSGEQSCSRKWLLQLLLAVKTTSWSDLVQLWTAICLSKKGQLILLSLVTLKSGLSHGNCFPNQPSVDPKDCPAPLRCLPGCRPPTFGYLY